MLWNLFQLILLKMPLLIIATKDIGNHILWSIKEGIISLMKEMKFNWLRKRCALKKCMGLAFHTVLYTMMR